MTMSIVRAIAGDDREILRNFQASPEMDPDAALWLTEHHPGWRYAVELSVLRGYLREYEAAGETRRELAQWLQDGSGLVAPPIAALDAFELVRELGLRVAAYRRCLEAERRQLAEVTRLAEVMMACPAAGRRSASTVQPDLDAYYAAEEAVEAAERILKIAVAERRVASQAVFDAALATFPETE